MNNKKKKINHLDSKLMKVCEVWGPVEAEIVKSFLKSNGIKCILKGLVVQSVHAFSADGLGKINILVDEKDYEITKKLIENR